MPIGSEHTWRFQNPGLALAPRYVPKNRLCTALSGRARINSTRYPTSARARWPSSPVQPTWPVSVALLCSAQPDSPRHRTTQQQQQSSETAPSVADVPRRIVHQSCPAWPIATPAPLCYAAATTSPPTYASTRLLSSHPRRATHAYSSGAITDATAMQTRPHCFLCTATRFCRVRYVGSRRLLQPDREAEQEDDSTARHVILERKYDSNSLGKVEIDSVVWLLI